MFFASMSFGPLLFGVRASAQTPGARSREVALSLDLDAGASSLCPTEASIRERLDQYLGGARIAAPIHAAVIVSTSGEGFVVQLEVDVDGALSARSFTGPQCASLLDAALLVASLHAEIGIDEAHERVERVVEPVVIEAVMVEPVVPVEPVVLVEPEDAHAPQGADLASGWAEPARSDLALLVRAGPMLTLGPVPEAAFGAGIEVGMQIGVVEVMIGGAWASETTASLSTSRGAVIALYEGSARVGLRLDLPPVALLAHGIVGVGALMARGYGTDHPMNGVTPWVELGGGVEARAVFASAEGVEVGASLVGDVIGAVTSPRFTLDGTLAFVPSDVGARFTVGLWLRVE